MTSASELNPSSVETKPALLRKENEESKDFDHAPQDPKYYFDDGNIRVLTNKQMIFFVHRFKLEEFSELKIKMASERENRYIDLPDSPEDFHNMLEVIYSCPCALDPPAFEPNVLISSLRLATKYNYPALRKFAICKLEMANLSWIEYFPMARECNIPEWEAMVLDKLAARAEPITMAEGKVLGVIILVPLAARREASYSGASRATGRRRTAPEQQLTREQEDEQMREAITPAKRSSRTIQLPDSKRPKHPTGTS